MTNPNEERFEAAICDFLVGTASGPAATRQSRTIGCRANPRDFDPMRGLDTAELYAFIGATQADAWSELVKRCGGDPDVAQAKFADRLAAELDKRGVVDVLRHGVVDLGVTIRPAYFRLAHGLTPELVSRYEANRLTATRQLRYAAGEGRSPDLALLVNGIPVATAELKNPLTGQGVEQAVGQYRTDRDPKTGRWPGPWSTSPSTRSGWR